MVLTISQCKQRLSYLSGDRGLHAIKLLVPLRIPQLVQSQSNVQDHSKLQAASEQAYGGVVDGHHLRGVVLYQAAAE